MTFDLAQPTGPLWPLVVIGVTCVIYVVFFYFARAERLLRFVDHQLEAEDRQARSVHLQRISGALLLGGVPAGLAWAIVPGSWADVGLGLARPLEAAVSVGALLVVVLPIIFLQTRQPKLWTHYPEVRASRWSRRRYAANGASWAVYLLGYEFLFRGLLLFTLARWLGPWPAVAITTLAYVWAHLGKFSGETLGAIPVGVLFAVAALYTGGLWAPFVAHVIIANFSDMCTTWHNPRIRRAG